MKLSGSTLLLLLIFVSQAWTQHPWPPQGEEGRDYFLNYQGEPKADGLHYRTYQNGNLYYSGEFEMGKPKPNSDFYYYFFEHDGALMSAHHFGEDSNFIEAQNYFDSGKIQSEGHYYHQKKEGLWTFYEQQGYVTSMDEFKADSLHGVSKVFYPSGHQFQELEYNNGTKNGAWVEWFEDGKIKIKTTYKNGRFDGAYIQNHSSGMTMIQGQYLNGKEDGVWIKFHSDGRIERTMKFTLGVKVSEKLENGTAEDFYANNIPKYSYEYENGEKNGPFVEWYEMGEWVRVPAEGKALELGFQFIEEIKGAQKSCEGEYLKDKLDGEITYYDTAGRIVKTEYYTDGNLESVEEK